MFKRLVKKFIELMLKSMKNHHFIHILLRDSISGKKSRYMVLMLKLDNRCVNSSASGKNIIMKD